MSARESLPQLESQRRGATNVRRTNFGKKEWKKRYLLDKKGGEGGRHREPLECGCRRTMPGSLVLLVSLLVLTTGSDARRIRKRGLNQKVGLLSLPEYLFLCTYEGVKFFLCVFFRRWK